MFAPHETIQRKVFEIKKTPYKLRRTLQSYPYYATLDKCLMMYNEELTEDEKQRIKQFVNEHLRKDI